MANAGAARLGSRVLAVLVIASVAVSFAPWLQTGTARRTSYQVVRAADRLQVLDPGIQAVVSVLWAFLPLLAVASIAALIAERTLLAAALAAAIGLMQVALASAVKIAPRSADWGTDAGFVAGLALVVAALGTASITRSTS